MCASTRDLTGDGKDDQDKETGIVGTHAYSLLGAYELLKTSKGNYRLLKPFEKAKGKKIR